MLIPCSLLCRNDDHLPTIILRHTYSVMTAILPVLLCNVTQRDVNNDCCNDRRVDDNVVPLT